jgi:tetratricopeptide (TPR) repeat protein
MLRKSGVPSLGLALFLFGTLATAGLISQAPAFNAEIRTRGVLGEAQNDYAPAMYDRAQHLSEMGYGYMHGDILIGLSGAEALGLEEGIEASMARFSTASDLFEESLRLDPANGFTWLFYASVLVGTNEIETARRAFKHSWETAPTSVQAARRRIPFATQLDALLQVRKEQLSQKEKAMIESDHRLLQ